MWNWKKVENTGHIGSVYACALGKRLVFRFYSTSSCNRYHPLELEFVPVLW